MTKRALYIAVAVLALTPTLSYARDTGPGHAETLADQQRCDALTKQWNQASATAKVTDSAKKDAAQGEVLCRAGKYDEGSRTLASALTQIGAKPM